jgi:hypothetical protein
VKIVAYKDMDKAKWDKLVNDSSYGWLYHTTAYVDWAVEVEGNANASFAVVSDTDEILALCPLYFGNNVFYYSYDNVLNGILLFAIKAINKLLFHKFFRVRSLGTGLSGPIWNSRNGLKGARKALKMVNSELDRIARREGADVLTVRHTECAPGYCPDIRPDYDMLTTIDSYQPLQVPGRLVNFIDLRMDVDAIWGGIDQECRALVNKGRKNDLTFETDRNLDYEQYYEIHKVSWTRSIGHHHPKEHFKGMVDALRPHGGVEFLFASKQGRPIGGVMLHVFKGRAIYYAGSSLDESLSLGANNFLLYNAILWAKEQGCEWFCVGVFESFPGKNRKEYSVGHYKSQFSNRWYPAFESKKVYTKKGLFLEGQKDRRVLAYKLRERAQIRSEGESRS